MIWVLKYCYLAVIFIILHGDGIETNIVSGEGDLKNINITLDNKNFPGMLNNFNETNPTIAIYVNKENKTHIILDKNFFDKSLQQKINEIKSNTNSEIEKLRIDFNENENDSISTNDHDYLKNDLSTKILPLMASTQTDKTKKYGSKHKGTPKHYNSKPLDLKSYKEKCFLLNEKKLDILEADLAKKYEFEKKKLQLLQEDSIIRAKLHDSQEILFKTIILKQAETLINLMGNEKK